MNYVYYYSRQLETFVFLSVRTNERLEVYLKCYIVIRTILNVLKFEALYSLLSGSGFPVVMGFSNIWSSFILDIDEVHLFGYFGGKKKPKENLIQIFNL